MCCCQLCANDLSNEWKFPLSAHLHHDSQKDALKTIRRKEKIFFCEHRNKGEGKSLFHKFNIFNTHFWCFSFFFSSLYTLMIFLEESIDEIESHSSWWPFQISFDFLPATNFVIWFRLYRQGSHFLVTFQCFTFALLFLPKMTKEISLLVFFSSNLN